MGRQAVTERPICILGAGYVGLVSGACLAEAGASSGSGSGGAAPVLCIDIDDDLVARLCRGELPLHEPGLAALVARGLGSGRLAFSSDPERVQDAQVVLVSVGTWARRGDDRTDVSHVHAAARSVAPFLAADALVVTRSTVPVGTTRALGLELARLTGRAIAVASNPEFLREGSAITDFMHPARVVIGCAPGPAGDDAAVLLRTLYAPLDAPVLRLSLESAELAKYAANALLATKVSFMNELSALCEVAGADVAAIAEALALDPRIGPGHLTPGPGLGGSCLPKDLRALAEMAEAHGVAAHVARGVLAADAAHKRRLADGILALAPRRVAILGLSFKADTSDLRSSPALDLITTLRAHGITLAAHDPHAATAPAARPLLPADVALAPDPYAACADADVTVIATEWDSYRSLDLTRIAATMRGRHLVDLRAIIAPTAAAAASLDLYTLGQPRPAVPAGTVNRQSTPLSAHD